LGIGWCDLDVGCVLKNHPCLEGGRGSLRVGWPMVISHKWSLRLTTYFKQAHRLLLSSGNHLFLSFSRSVFPPSVTTYPSICVEQILHILPHSIFLFLTLYHLLSCLQMPFESVSSLLVAGACHLIGTLLSFRVLAPAKEPPANV
jgi:hypothetical protein